MNFYSKADTCVWFLLLFWLFQFSYSAPFKLSNVAKTMCVWYFAYTLINWKTLMFVETNGWRNDFVQIIFVLMGMTIQLITYILLVSSACQPKLILLHVFHVWVCCCYSTHLNRSFHPYTNFYNQYFCDRTKIHISFDFAIKILGERNRRTK